MKKRLECLVNFMEQLNEKRPKHDQLNVEYINKKKHETNR